MPATRARASASPWADRRLIRQVQAALQGGVPVEVPHTVSAALEAIFEEPVHRVRIFEHSWLLRLHGRAIATTRWRRIYLRGSGAELFASPWLMLHEYCHVLKQWETRRLTRTRYLLECARRGYWRNRFEVEARAFADTHAKRLQSLLASSCPARAPS